MDHAVTNAMLGPVQLAKLSTSAAMAGNMPPPKTRKTQPFTVDLLQVGASQVGINHFASRQYGGFQGIDGNRNHHASFTHGFLSGMHASG
jgi:hypothetical protein